MIAGGAALGLAPALAAGLALDLRGHRLRTPDDVERRVDLETLGAIGRFRQSPGSALPTDEYPEALQAYQELATSLKARGGPEVRTVLVTSAGPEEGKSTTAANLATVLAEMGHKVILVDGDLRWSSLRSTNASASSLGLSGLLLNYLHTPQLAVVRTNERNLFLLPAGILPPNPQELLALPRLGDIIASLREMADYVIFDSPPILEAEDTKLLARNADATLLVMNAGRTRSREVNKALGMLMEVDALPLGAVLNGIKTPKRVAAKAPEPASELARRIEPVYAPPATPVPTLEPFTVDAFRKGTPKPPDPNKPRPRAPEAEPAVVRLAQEGLPSAPPMPAAAPNGFDTPDYRSRVASLRNNLRVVQPDERPLAPAVNDWEPVLPTKPSLTPEPPKPSLSAIEVPTPAPVASTRPVAPTKPAEPDVSVDDVLAHMEETLRLIREMRHEKSTSNT